MDQSSFKTHKRRTLSHHKFKIRFPGHAKIPEEPRETNNSYDIALTLSAEEKLYFLIECCKDLAIEYENGRLEGDTLKTHMHDVATIVKNFEQ